jgi:hypothetical protein
MRASGEEATSAVSSSRFQDFQAEEDAAAANRRQRQPGGQTPVVRFAPMVESGTNHVNLAAEKSGQARRTSPAVHGAIPCCGDESTFEIHYPNESRDVKQEMKKMNRLEGELLGGIAGYCKRLKCVCRGCPGCPSDFADAKRVNGYETCSFEPLHLRRKRG